MSSLSKKFAAAVAAAKREDENADAPAAVVEDIRTVENRQRHLADFMADTLHSTAREIEKIGYWKATPTVREIEAEIERIFDDVIRGVRKLAEYRAVVERWKVEGTKH